MGKPNFKSIFSAPLVIVSSLRKFKINGFLGGIIIGAIFSMLVNLITVQIQEVISKQRILEAVEWEIVNNTLQASSVTTQANQRLKDKADYNIFFTYSSYSRDLWEQSTEPLQYISQLSPEVATKIAVYYSVVIKNQNEFIEKLSKVSDSVMNGCYDVLNEVSEKKKVECDITYLQLEKAYVNTADVVFKNGMDVLDQFHPTKDRLSSWFLKLMMGDESVKILSGK